MYSRVAKAYFRLLSFEDLVSAGGYDLKTPSYENTNDELEAIKITKQLAINQQILVMAYIEFLSKATSDMTKEELIKLYVDISDKYNVPNDLIKEMAEKLNGEIENI